MKEPKGTCMNRVLSISQAEHTVSARAVPTPGPVRAKMPTRACAPRQDNDRISAFIPVPSSLPPIKRPRGSARLPASPAGRSVRLVLARPKRVADAKHIFRSVLRHRLAVDQMGIIAVLG